MSLKKLEVFGFKSFADRTEVVFEPGVTCVVGPNGCGKSNVSDSIRWVLGERSAKMLRGSKMEDIIFNGTDYRKPLGFSEVHLTIDNSKKIISIDYDEVVISRKIYRSGESEYYINKTLCRYKDIQDLISDTGIGSNSYSMIEQGRIDYILQADPEERRFLIEEAAGISKFKTKKEEALKKLERTEENLLRIGDIIAELEKNIKYAERQAKRAERYREQFDTLKQLEIKKAVWELNNLDTIKNDLEGKKSKITEQQNELQAEFTEKESVLKESRSKIQSLESDISFGELKKIELTSKTNSLRDKIYFNVERIGSLKNQWIEAENEISSSQDRIKQLTSDIENIEKEVTSKEKELKEKENDLNSIQDSLRIEQEKYSVIKVSLEKSLLELISITQKRNSNLNETTRVESSIISNKTRTEQKSQEITSLEQEKANIKLQIEEIRTKEKAGLEQKSILEETLGVVQENLRIKETEIESILSRMLKAEGRRKELQAHVDILSGKSTVQHSGGIFKAFDEIRKSVSSKLFGKTWFLKETVSAKPGFENVHNQLLCVFSEDSLIFNSADVLAEAGEIAKKSAEFPVTSIFSSQNTGTPQAFEWKGERFTPVSSQLNFASDISIFRQIFTSNKSASELFQMGIQEVTGDKQILANDGILIGPGPLVTFPKSQAVDFSTERLSQIAPEKEMLERQVSEYGETEKRLKEERALMSNDKAKVQEDLQKLRTELESEIKLTSSLENNMIRIQQKVDSSRLELDQLSSESSRFDTLLAELNAKAKELETEDLAIQNNLENLKHSEASQASKLEIEKMKQVRQETEVISIRERFGLLSNHLKQSQEAVQTETQRIESKRKSISDCEASIKQLTEDNNAFSLEIENFVAMLSETETNLGGVKENLEIEKVQSVQFEREVQSLREALGALKEELHQAEFKFMESGYARNSIIDRVRQAYKIDLEVESNQITLTAEENIDEITNQITSLKEKLESYGAVNLLAVDEFTELKTRFDFLVSQKNDLVNARDALLDAIRKINKTTKQLFEDTFRAVQVNFQVFFEMLFKGGQAQLALLDEENPLESGIEIMVRPPGKKLQQISLLSGGEKALTAIALLFSIFKIKPSPFCVLDEVDAPLDEANVDRFLAVLRTFLDSTQFIIITHNRKTISMGDALYGVTMEETGVSKLVSVRINQNERSTQLLKPVEIGK